MNKKIIVALLVLSVLLLVIGCGNKGKEPIVDESLVCLPTEDLASLQDNPVESLDEIVPGLTDDIESIEPVESVVITDPETEPVETVVIEDEPVIASPVDASLRKIYNEGDLVKLSPKATDPDNDDVSFTFSLPLNENGEWQTKIGDAGEYIVTITATDGKDITTKEVLLVIEAINKAPVIEKLNDLVVSEGALVSLEPNVIDPDGDSVNLVYNSPLDINGQWQTDYNSAGKYQLTITASDGLLESKQTISLTVNNVNRAPVLEQIEHVAVTEGDLISLYANVKANDPDGDTIKLTYSSPLDTNGQWQTVDGDVGSYVVTITASDGEFEASRTISIIVNALNHAPIIAGLEDVIIEETSFVNIDPVVSDEDGDSVTVTYSTPLNANGEWQTGYDNAGTYQVTITATDGKATVTQTVKITVEDKNRPPEFVI